MASDMSGYQGEEGKRRWIQESGGTEADYNREMGGWQQSASAPASTPASAPATQGQGYTTQATAASQNASQSLGGVVLPPGATGFNAADPTAYRNIDPNIIRNMTPEQRAEWSAQNIDDLSAHGDATRARAQWMAWQKSYDPNCPPSDPYQAEDGSGCVEKPDNSNKGGQSQDGGDGGGQGGRGGQGGQYTPPPPPKPVTFGNQLSMTGNPLQDMLIGQFNTGMDPNSQQANIFGLGEDMRVGGAGRNLDQGKTAPTRQGQSLAGGGLWWGQDKETFGGFDASQKNAEGAATVSPAAPKPAAVQEAPAAPAAPPQQSPASRIGGMYVAQKRPPKQTPMAGMVQNQFSNPARNRASYF
jgi:hypothetical protein